SAAALENGRFMGEPPWISAGPRPTPDRALRTSYGAPKSCSRAPGIVGTRQEHASPSVGIARVYHVSLPVRVPESGPVPGGLLAEIDRGFRKRARTRARVQEIESVGDALKRGKELVHVRAQLAHRHAVVGVGLCAHDGGAVRDVDVEHAVLLE